MTAIPSNRRFRLLRRAVIAFGVILFAVAIPIVWRRPLNSSEVRLSGCWYRPALFANRLMTLDANHRYTIHTGWFDEAHNRFVAKASVETGHWSAGDEGFAFDEDRPPLTRLKVRWAGDNLARVYRFRFQDADRLRLDRGAFYDDWTRIPSPPEIIISPDSAEP